MNMNTPSAMIDLVPPEFYLSQNYPNPFSERTTLKFCVAYKTKVKLEVFNAEGDLIEILADEDKEAGTYGVEFSANDYHSREGGNLSEGSDCYQMKVGDFVDTKNLILLK